MSFLQNLFSSIQKSDLAGISSESEHINQEMYKKSAELNERNKTLALLQKIDGIILSTITNLSGIGQSVTSLLVTEADFQLACILLNDKEKKVVKILALSQAGESPTQPSVAEIALSDMNNIIIQTLNEKTIKTATTLKNIFPADMPIASTLQYILVCPLATRGELIGAMVIGLKESEDQVSEYRKDLIHRLSELIGIAMDNALLYNEVQTANARLKQLDKLKDEFVSVASHELRTPMTAIKSYLWMALAGKGGNTPEKQKFYLERSYTSVDRLIRLVNDMLNVSRIDSGRIDIQLAAVNLPQLVQEVFDEVMPRSQELGVNLSISPAQSLPQVLADSDKIKEVLFNLIGNSLKFTPKGGMITVSFVQKDNMIETIIKDTGTGIAPEDAGKLFAKFSMIASSYIPDRSIQGSGLGLYISKSIIELHGGKIWAESAGLGKGTQFTFSLKILNEKELEKISQKPKDEAKQSVGIVHSEI